MKGDNKVWPQINAKIMKAMLTTIFIESLDYNHRSGFHLTLRIGGTFASLAKNWEGVWTLWPPVPTSLLASVQSVNTALD